MAKQQCNKVKTTYITEFSSIKKSPPDRDLFKLSLSINLLIYYLNGKATR